MDDDDNDFQDEYAARERAGGGSNIGLVGPDGKIDRSLQSPLDKFKIAVDATARDLKDQVTYIDETDIIILIDNANNLPDIHYKNPSAYVLGYIVSTGGRKPINKNIFTKILPIMQLIPGSVTAPDIIRYARLWLDLTSGGNFT